MPQYGHPVALACALWSKQDGIVLGYKSALIAHPCNRATLYHLKDCAVEVSKSLYMK